MTDSSPRTLPHARHWAFALGLFIVLGTAFWAHRFFNGPASETDGAASGTKPRRMAARGAAHRVQTEAGAGLDTAAQAPPSQEEERPQDPEQAQAEAKEAKLAEMVVSMRQYARLWEEVGRQVPAMATFWDTLRQWREYRPELEYPELQKELAELMKSREELLPVFFKIMHLQRAAVLLDMIDHPSPSFDMREVFEDAGLNVLVPREIALLDIYAGAPYDPAHTGPVTMPAPRTLAEYRALLEPRIATYAEATRQLAQDHGIAPVVEAPLLAVMAEKMRREIMVSYLEVYHDSFFAGEIDTQAAKIRQMVDEYHAFPKHLPVPPALWQEFIALAEANAISPLSDVPVDIHGVIDDSH